MNPLTIVGSILLALGLAGVLWGVVDMVEDRDTLEIGDVQVIVDEGDFPPHGIAGALSAAAGVLFIAAGAVTGRKS